MRLSKLHNNNYLKIPTTTYILSENSNNISENSSNIYIFNTYFMLRNVDTSYHYRGVITHWTNWVYVRYINIYPLAFNINI